MKTIKLNHSTCSDEADIKANGGGGKPMYSLALGFVGNDDNGSMETANAKAIVAAEGDNDQMATLMSMAKDSVAKDSRSGDKIDVTNSPLEAEKYAHDCSCKVEPQ